MSYPSGAALAEHLQRYGNDHAENDSDDSNRSDSYSAEQEGDGRRSGDDIVDASRPGNKRCPRLPFSKMWWPGRADAVSDVLVQLWHQYHPVMMDFVREYGAILVALVFPFTPHAARRAGYGGASQDIFRALDRLDTGLPGGARGWSERWFNRPRGRRDNCPRGLFPLDGKGGGVGVAATAVVLAAASWCSWRRSSPTWPVLLFELACGSTVAANYLAREDGRREARVLENRLVALNHALGPFFRRVESCLRMIKCSQALSFGLRLSVPMPPVARMEGRLKATGGSHARQQQSPLLALRELRAVLADVLDGALDQSDTFGAMPSSDGTEGCQRSTAENVECESHASESGNNLSPDLLLGGMASTEKHLAANLSRLVADLADRVDEAVMKQPEEWGLWWKSQLVGVSEVVRDMVEYFEAASERLEVAMGSDCASFSILRGSSLDGDTPAIAETLSALRLRFEETVVRLYSCQRSVSAILRDPAVSTEDAWEGVRHGLAGALESTRAGGTDEDLWRKAEELLDSLMKENSSRKAVGGSYPPPNQENIPDAPRHLESGVGWVSLTTPRSDSPSLGVFEGGNNGDEGPDHKPPDASQEGVTDVLVGMASPGRSRREENESRVSCAQPAELENERSRFQLLGELGSVLRARPTPSICEKHLPLESQQALNDENKACEEEKEDHGLGVMEDITPALSSPPTELAMRQVPVSESADNQELMRELRAQLSMAANEEIFSSDRNRWAVESDSDVDGEESILIEREEHKTAQAGAGNKQG